MKAIGILLGLTVSIFAWAQTAGIKDIPAEGETTISISKGKGQVEWAITDGTAEISGEPEILGKAARASWKKECDDWRKEIKELNKDNQVLAISCNKPNCAKNGGSETVCESTGTYKLKTKVK